MTRRCHSLLCNESLNWAESVNSMRERAKPTNSVDADVQSAFNAWVYLHCRKAARSP